MYNHHQTLKLLAHLLERAQREARFDGRKQIQPTLSEYLRHLLEKKRLKRVRIIEAAGLNSTFGYQIFMGQRNASRDKLLALCCAMRLSLIEANTLLGSGGVNELRARTRRDAIIMYGLLRGYDMMRINDCLYRWGSETLTKR